ncbi:ABC transporter substrate-binding protein [Actinomadura adrarensis]|uniref:ABC transporter substrate-binding protein n=1 Tax=Actinomadura adrarensis TaxID=1819600 RepID=A0ABW3CU68_9ACTN
MRKLCALLGMAAVLVLLAACGNKPTSAAKTVDFTTLDDLVAAAKKEGSVLLYTDMLPADTKRLQTVWGKTYPDIDLQIKTISGTDLLTRFESESESGAPSADVVSSAQPDYYADASKRGLITPLQETGVLKLVPNYPKKYLFDDLKTALIQAVPAGFIYNTKVVPADKAPRDWPDLLDPFWKGKVLSDDKDDTSDINALITLARLRDAYGEKFLGQLRAQLGPVQGGFQPMQAAVGAGEGAAAIQSLEFIVAGMQKEGAPVKFVPVSHSHWAVHGFGVSAKATRPAAARLLAQFLLTPEGSESVSSSIGEYGPYDQIPEKFVPVTLAEIERVRKDAKQILAAYKA